MTQKNRRSGSAIPTLACEAFITSQPMTAAAADLGFCYAMVLEVVDEGPAITVNRDRDVEWLTDLQLDSIKQLK
jgi:hypothetical protein